MRIKEYKIYKTAKKTAEKNSLVIADGFFNPKVKHLFDFSLLDEIDIPNEEKEVIKKDAISNVRSSNTASYYSGQYDELSYCNGKAKYHVQRVCTPQGMIRYIIFSLAEIEHNRINKQNLTSEYKRNVIVAKNGYDETVFDIQI